MAHEGHGYATDDTVSGEGRAHDEVPSRRQQWRRRVYPLAAISVLFAVVALVALSTSPGESRVGGDYPAFYGAGELAADGRWDDLYDPAAQQEQQAGLVDDAGGYLYFAYPPYVAAAYGGMSLLGYSMSFLLQALLMGLALALALRLMSDRVPAIAAAPWAAYALALFFFPMLMAVIGGQNTALTLALIVGAAWAERNDRDWLAGIAIGLLFYKPQFAVPLLLLLLVARRWRAVATAVGTATLLWLSGVVLMGGDWVTVWWEEARAFAEINETVNGHLFVSLPGAMGQATGEAGTALGWALAAGVALTLAVVWWRLGARHPWVRYAVAATGVILVQPQALFYEAGLLVLPLALLWVQRPDRRRWVWVLWLTAWLQPLATTIDISPLFITVAATFAWYLYEQRDLLTTGRRSTTPV